MLSPVIRVFLSSTFVDMEHERNYFNTVIVPQLTKLCSDRGISFFSVDLRWGITQEDRLNGKVIPICLREIDNCRPFFIGVLGNRYGDIVNRIDDDSEMIFPWVKGKSGKSVSELEMLYGALDPKINKDKTNCAFFFRSESLTKSFFPDKKEPLEEQDKQEKLLQLKDLIRSTDEVPLYEYDSLEQFKEYILRTFSTWLERDFPNEESVIISRKKWYNRELLRDYVGTKQITTFFNSYCMHSDKSLLIIGEGLRGKTTALTYWQPNNGHKILVNCASDYHYLYWTEIAHEIVREINKVDQNAGFPDSIGYASLAFRLADSLNSHENKRENIASYYVTDDEEESFSNAFKEWLKCLDISQHIYIVINDVNLIIDKRNQYLNWLPVENSSKIHIICSTHSEEIAENAKALGWNTKEIPFFTESEANCFLDQYMKIFGKQFSQLQRKDLLSSSLMFYPGYLKFAIKFLNNYGTFDNLNFMTKKIGEEKTPLGLYRFIWDDVLQTIDDSQSKVVQVAAYTLCVTSIGLHEDELYGIVSRITETNMLLWSDALVILDLFSLTGRELWKGEDPAFCELAKTLPVDEVKVHTVLWNYFYECLNKSKASTLNGIRSNTEYANAALFHCSMAKDWDKLSLLLEDRVILYFLSKRDWRNVRSAWMKVFLHSDIPVAKRLDYILHLLIKEKTGIEGIQYRFIGLLTDLEQIDTAKKVSEELGIRVFSDLRSIRYGLSPSFLEKYTVFSEMKKRHEYYNLYNRINMYLQENMDALNPLEQCCILFLKYDCEHELQLYEECGNTTYKYYKVAIASQGSYEILHAMMTRSEAKYCLAQYKEAELIARQAFYKTIQEGALREYLTTCNLLGRCCYREGKYDEAIELFDQCISVWNRLGNIRESTAVQLNRINSIALKGDTELAFWEAKKIIQQLGNYSDEQLIIMRQKILVNMGVWAEKIGKDDEVEAVYKEAIDIGLRYHEKVSLRNDYMNLFYFHLGKNHIRKAINTGTEFLDYLYSHRQYQLLKSMLPEVINALYIGGYHDEADILQQNWKKKLESIPTENGKQKSSIQGLVISDDIDEQKELLAVARSESDYEKCGIIQEKIAFLQEQYNQSDAVNTFLMASNDYRHLNLKEESLRCMYNAIRILLRVWDTDPRATKLNNELDDAEKQVVSCWKRLCSTDISNERYNEEIISILNVHGCDLSLIDICLNSEVDHIASKCDVNTIHLVLDYIKGLSGAKIFSQRLEESLLKDFYEDISRLKTSFVGSYADNKIPYYEKCIEILIRLGSSEIGVVAGNIALIFRRRGEKDKTFHYHELAMEQFLKSNKEKDCYIEAENLATAYEKFGSPEKAVDLLRKSLQELQNKDFFSIRAAMAGNLASLLSNDPSADEDEIKKCFAIEEEYFEKNAEERDLVISLYNQIRFLLRDSNKNIDAIQEKYQKVTDLVYRYKIKDFFIPIRELGRLIHKNSTGRGELHKTDNLSFLIKSIISKMYSKKNESPFITPDEVIKRLLSEEGHYKIEKILERNDPNYLYVLCLPNRSFPGISINLHLTVAIGNINSIEILFSLQPHSNSPHIQTIMQHYANWWNTQNDYWLLVQEEGPVLLAAEKSDFHNLEKVISRFCHIAKLWSIDALNMSLAVMGEENLEKLCDVKQKIMDV